MFLENISGGFKTEAVAVTQGLCTLEWGKGSSE